MPASSGEEDHMPIQDSEIVIELQIEELETVAAPNIVWST
jgi:hypothetical protein